MSKKMPWTACADIARAGELISGASPVPSQAASIAFSAGLGALCYGLAPKVMDNVNTVLVGGVVLTFLVRPLSCCQENAQDPSIPASLIVVLVDAISDTNKPDAACKYDTSLFVGIYACTIIDSCMMQGLLGAAAPGVDPQALLKADFSAVPKTLPVLSLAFVFHNIIPVISTDLEVRFVSCRCTQ